jgi:hypothetical protein
VAVDIGKGNITAFEALSRLYESWTERMPLLSPEEDAFFSRGLSLLVHFIKVLKFWITSDASKLRTYALNASNIRD